MTQQNMTYTYDSNTKYLNMSFNRFNLLSSIDIPYSEITEIDLSYNNLTKIPKEIFKMTNLVSLRLSCNNISIIPSDITKLQKLKYLSLMTNNIKEIPSQINDLPNLKELLLGHNPITKMPSNFNETKYSWFVDSQGNNYYNGENCITHKKKTGKIIDNNYLPSYDEINQYNYTYVLPPTYDDN